jgi:hypothetical protein
MKLSGASCVPSQQRCSHGSCANASNIHIISAVISYTQLLLCRVLLEELLDERQDVRSLMVLGGVRLTASSALMFLAAAALANTPAPGCKAAGNCVAPKACQLVTTSGSIACTGSNMSYPANRYHERLPSQRDVCDGSVTPCSNSADGVCFRFKISVNPDCSAGIDVMCRRKVFCSPGSTEPEPPEDPEED